MEECVIKHKGNFYLKTEMGCKKIILTTDQDLIKDGVQAIDDEFLEWFVKNPSCDEVEVNWVKTPDGIFYHQENVPYGCYKIILPKEEPKQETLEEAAEKHSKEMFSKNGDLNAIAHTSFIKGAKWQQERSYSEEEVRKMLEDAVHESRMQDDKSEDYIVNETIFEFKKK